MSKSKKTFAKLLEELEKIAAELEEGDIDLENAIKKYEAGIRAYRECRKFLDSAQKKIEILSKDASGNFVAKDFDIKEEHPEKAEPEEEADEKKSQDDNDENNGGKEKTLF